MLVFMLTQNTEVQGATEVKWIQCLLGAGKTIVDAVTDNESDEAEEEVTTAVVSNDQTPDGVEGLWIEGKKVIAKIAGDKACQKLGEDLGLDGILGNAANLIEKTEWEKIQQGGNFFSVGWNWITGGRRRKDYNGINAHFVNDAANSDICGAANQAFADKGMMKFAMSLVKDQDNHDTMMQLSDTMGNWANHEAEKSRRRVEGGLAHEWIDYIDTLAERYGEWTPSNDNEMSAPEPFRRITQNWENLLENNGLRRLGKGSTYAHAKIPSIMYKQAFGYSVAMNLIIAGGDEDAAAVFGYGAKGSASEQMHGCASVINQVNFALEAGEIKGLSIVENGAGEEVVAVDESLARKLRGFVTVITLASGLVANVLMRVCDQYSDLAKIM